MLYKFLVNAKYRGVYHLAGDEIELSDASLLEGLVEPLEKESISEPVADIESDKADTEEDKADGDEEDEEETEDEEPEDEEE